MTTIDTSTTSSGSGYARLTPDEAAELISHEMRVGMAGFTPAGAAKAVPSALARRARAHHARGEPFVIDLLTGASTGSEIDDELGAAEAIRWRAPYQTSKPLRDQINRGTVEFVDMHLSHVGQMLEFGFLGELDVAVVEAVDVTSDGRVYLSTSVGASPHLLAHADKVIVEVNRAQHARLAEMHDISVMPRPPQRHPIPIHHPLDKIGSPFCRVDPARIVGVVETDQADKVPSFNAPDAVSARIASHVVEFLKRELAAGRIPAEFLPLQAGVGNVANAVMGLLADDPDIPDFDMYTEVYQDAMVQPTIDGRIRGVSTAALTLSPEVMRRVFDDMDFFAPRLVLRPTEISNNPGVIRRLGVISLNTVLEFDVFGMANSTHVAGTKLMNGIGGSGDFCRNAYLSILMAPSVAKGGKISAVVPMVSHVDHNEHSVQVVVTEQGLADLRGLGPIERARTIIETCAHPAYRGYLHKYLEDAPPGHFRHDLSRVFELHRNLLEHGSMLPGETIQL